MDKPSTSAASDGGIPPPIMTIKLPLGTPNKNVKKRELEDDSEMRLEDFLREFEIGKLEREKFDFCLDGLPQS